MEQPVSVIELLFERIEAYGKTTIELSKLKALETIAATTVSAISRLSVVLMIVLFALTLSTGLALWIGELLGKSYYGFFVVAAFYLVGSIALYLFLPKWLKKPVSSSIISKMYP
jgi:hypothetical protein